jgi:hypothetical protein
LGKVAGLTFCGPMTPQLGENESEKTVALDCRNVHEEEQTAASGRRVKSISTGRKHQQKCGK